MLQLLNDQFLLETYYHSINYQLDEEFLTLLRRELMIRNLLNSTHPSSISPPFSSNNLQ
ncbi:sporulation histidine kinase inhibitor Sda [Halalkalibacter krulwichiae]|uniref:Sporulation inhibitor A n=1 Tax=Halalkalibacter krulwichiae TaxID=199441 RepID=A0A1X9MD40_9BACI|nr:sporulation histidine kinase inhibitor Sda [Halalkalibacter krulwichiae]ARK29471.1 Sporulation inhibitor A [Halalkalibacter krulwichiae]